MSIRNREYKRIAEKLHKKGRLSHDDLESVKRNLELREMLSVMESANKFNNLSSRLFSDADNYNSLLKYRFPSIFSSMKDVRTLEREIAWEINCLTAQVCLKSDVIRDFICAREDFEVNFMRGDYSNAVSVINEYEQNYGPSFWTIDSRISALAFSGGKGIEKFYSQIEEENIDIFILTYLKISKVRFLKGVTATYFNVLLKDIWEEYDAKTIKNERNFRIGFKDYVMSKIDLTFEYDLYEIRNLLNISDRLTSVDKYILLEHLLSWLCSNSIYNETFILKDIANCASLLWERTNAITWFNIGILLGERLNIEPNAKKQIVNACLENFCTGKKDVCHELCKKELLVYSNCFPLIDLLAKSGENENNSTPYIELAGVIRELYLKEKKNSEFSGLLSICDEFERIFSHFTFGNQLGVIIENETKPIDVNEKIRYIMSLILSEYPPSKLAFFLKGENRNFFIEKYKEVIGPLYFSDWHIATYTEATSDIISSYKCDSTSYCLNRIKAEIYKKWDDLISITQPLDNMGKRIAKSYFFKRQFNIFVDSNDILSAINIYIQAYFSSQWMVVTIDYKRINDTITRRTKRDLEYNFSYCLYAYITRFELLKGEAISETVVTSCKKILNSIGGKSPIELLESNLPNSKGEIVYFLRNICTYDALRRIDTKLVQELYGERIAILDKIKPYYEEKGKHEDVNALEDERSFISSKLNQLDIVRCINRGKINTSWIVFSEEADAAILSMYNLYNNAIDNNKLSAYINAFAIVKKDYVLEINRILSITIRHGILEGELLRFLKKNGISSEQNYLSIQEQHVVDEFIQNLYNFINSLMKNYIVATYKYEDERKLLLFVDEKVLQTSFESLPEYLSGPEEIKKEYRRILENELEECLNYWGSIVCQHIYAVMNQLLERLCVKCSGGLKTRVNQTIDMLEDEVEKLKAWFSITENQDVEYKLATLCEVLEQEWEALDTFADIDDDFSITGSTINFLYTIIRELIWNAEKYGGYPEETTRIKVCIFIKEEYIVFEVDNYISEDSLNEVDHNINEIKMIIDSVRKADHTIQGRGDIYEGKSGYKKIVKLLKRKYEDNYQIDVGHRGQKFFAKISFVLEALH